MIVNCPRQKGVSGTSEDDFQMRCLFLLVSELSTGILKVTNKGRGIVYLNFLEDNINTSIYKDIQNKTIQDKTTNKDVDRHKDKN